MARDRGGWPGIQPSTGIGARGGRWGGGGGIARARRRDHLYCNSATLSESCPAPGASHFLHRFFFHIPFIGFHLQPFLRVVLLLLLLLIFALSLPHVLTVCLSCSPATNGGPAHGTGFPFYALVKCFP